MEDIYERYEDMCVMLKALSNPQRFMIARGLCENECNVKKIVEKLSIPQSTASSHIAKLRNAGIVKGKRKGNEICYTVTKPFIRELILMLGDNI